MSYDAPQQDAPAFEAPHEPAPERHYAEEVPREAAPERDYAAEAPRPEPVETEFVRSAPVNDWSPQERSFSETPRDAGGQSAPEGTGEPAPAPSDERQAG